jgi:hypothetical protein
VEELGGRSERESEHPPGGSSRQNKRFTKLTGDDDGKLETRNRGERNFIFQLRSDSNAMSLKGHSDTQF